MPDEYSDNPSAIFSAIAEQARLRVEECAGKAKGRPTYEREHDEALAKYHLYERHHGRTWTNNPAALIAQIKADLADPTVGAAGAARAFNKEQFLESWRRESENLIARFS